ncbi:hypothetical protein ALC62_07735 [Cyphomyrmex costatus]|uniref:Secreted protein n=1 Tax=Cyphomyrmex costatus TaxID=456900 RepID=A0A195CLH4_9HYME|nr:hypothetical protein ALC62_07735 [Cyphomyrmex costatus]
MVLLPIWITSGSCFALIHPGTNDVSPTTSRSLMRTIESLVRKATGVHFTFLQAPEKLDDLVPIRASPLWLTGNCERHFKDPLMHLTTAIATAVTQSCRIKTHLQQYAER